jgi:Coenzyme PQQ synthesis protein D (PqqD)
LTTQARYQVSSQVINEVIDGEAVMIDLATGSYYSLNDIGSVIWTFIEAGAAQGEIVDLLAQRYDAPVDEIVRAVGGLLNRLQQEGLVVPVQAAAVQPSPPAHDAGATTGQRLPFEPPTLDKYDDMQDLILLDPVHEVQEARGWPHVNPDVRGSAS